MRQLRQDGDARNARDPWFMGVNGVSRNLNFDVFLCAWPAVLVHRKAGGCAGAHEDTSAAGDATQVKQVGILSVLCTNT